MTIIGYFQVLRRNWLLVVGAAALGCALAALYCAITPRSYEGTVNLYVSTQAGTDNASSAYQGSLLSQQRVKSYTELLTGDRILSEVIQEQGLDSSVPDFRGKVSAEAKPDTVLLSVTVHDSDPVRAARLADALAGNFVTLVAELEQPLDRSKPPTVAARIVQPAPVDTAAVSPNWPLGLVGGALGGVILGLVFSIARVYLDRSIGTRADLEKASGLACLGQTGLDEKTADDSLVAVVDPLSPLSESYRQLRTNLQFANVDSPPKTIVVTSSIQSEGKTTLTCNLAVVLANTGSRVLLIDADLRRPRADSYFGGLRDVGLTTVLSGQVQLRQAIQRTAASGVEFLSSGAVPPNPSELLGSEQMREILTSVRHEYDYVVIDMPPVLPVTDASALARSVDGVLVACRQGGATRDDVAATVRSLSSVGAVLLGSVLTMTKKSKASGYGSGYYYAYAGDRPSSSPAAAMTDTMPRSKVGNSQRPTPMKRSG